MKFSLGLFDKYNSAITIKGTSIPIISANFQLTGRYHIAMRDIVAVMIIDNNL
jgi:hypothetical protein